MSALAHEIETEYVTLEECLALEESTGLKHEWVNGIVTAIAGANWNHNVIASNIIIRLGVQLNGKSCLPLGSDQRVKVPQTDLHAYPDVLVACPPHQWDEQLFNTLLNPKIIIEILSPSTASYDRGDKWDHYRRLDSLGDYVLVSSDRVKIEHFHRQSEDNWLLHIAESAEAAIALDSIQCTLSLREVYERIEWTSAEIAP